MYVKGDDRRIPLYVRLAPNLESVQDLNFRLGI